MLYNEVIDVCSENHTKHTNTVMAEHKNTEGWTWGYIKSPLGWVNFAAFPLLFQIVLPITEPFTYSGMSFSIPCWYQSLSCIIRHYVITAST
jgi:hypothetical protein